MLSVVFASLVFAVGGPTPEVELFAKEDFYKELKAPVQNFTGILKKTDRGDNVVGIGRYNAFRLEMDGGKVREVYVGAQAKRFDPYVGKNVKLIGKAMEIEVVGRVHHEIWAGSLVVLTGDKKEGKGAGMKIYGKTPARVGQGSSVIRSGEQLGKLQGVDAEKATANLARMLKVESIDWTKQMIVVISGGTQRTGGYSVEAKSLEVKDGKLVVNWKLNTPPPGSIVTQALTNPALTILVDRFEGDVTFEPKAPAPGLGKKLGGS